MRRLPVVRLDPGGHDPRPDRDRRRQQPRHRRRPRPARAPAVPARPAPAQGLHPRRGAPDHQGRLERAPQVARGAARLRHLHVRLDRAVGLPAGDPVAPPALRRPAPDRPRDRGQARRGSWPPTAARPTRPPSTSSPGSPPAACATPNRCSTSCCRPRPSGSTSRHVRDLLGLADAEVVEAFIDHLVRGDGAAGVALLDALEERGRDIRALLDQAVEAIRAELIAGLGDPATARHDPAALAAAGRRLAAIDPNRAGIGGLRFQLELAMFADRADVGGHAGSPGAAPGSALQRRTAAARPTPAPPRPHRRRARDTDGRLSSGACSRHAADLGDTAPNTGAPTPDPPPDSRPRRRRRPPPPGRSRRRATRRRAAPAHRSPPRTAAASAGRALERAARGLAGHRRAPQRPSADQAAHRRVPPGRGRRRRSSPSASRRSRRSSRSRPNAGARRSRPASPRSSAIRSPCAAWSPTSSSRRPRSDDLVAEARRIFADELADVGEVS